MVESEQFRDLIRFLRRDIKESDIPHRTKLRELILQAWTDDFKVLKGELAVSIQLLLVLQIISYLLESTRQNLVHI